MRMNILARQRASFLRGVQQMPERLCLCERFLQSMVASIIMLCRAAALWVTSGFNTWTTMAREICQGNIELQQQCYMCNLSEGLQLVVGAVHWPCQSLDTERSSQYRHCKKAAFWMVLQLQSDTLSHLLSQAPLEAEGGSQRSCNSEQLVRTAHQPSVSTFLCLGIDSVLQPQSACPNLHFLY